MTRLFKICKLRKGKHSSYTNDQYPLLYIFHKIHFQFIIAFVVKL